MADDRTQVGDAVRDKSVEKVGAKKVVAEKLGEAKAEQGATRERKKSSEEEKKKKTKEKTAAKKKEAEEKEKAMKDMELPVEVSQTPSEEVLERALKAKLKEKSWTGNRVLPAWAQQSLARDLAKQGRKEAKQEATSVLSAATVLSDAAIDYNPSIAAKQARRQMRRKLRKDAIDKFLEKGKVFQERISQDRKDVAVAVAYKDHLPGVRELVTQIYKGASTEREKRPAPVHMETGAGDKITFNPDLPLETLKADKIRERMFDPRTVEENTLYNVGITGPNPEDKHPGPVAKKAKATASAPRRISWNHTISTEFYDPANPDVRNKGSRQHLKLVTYKSPTPAPLNAPRPFPTAAFARPAYQPPPPNPPK